MKLAVLKEDGHEGRVAISPQQIQKLRQLDIEVFIEKDAGKYAHFNDEAYLDQGAMLLVDAADLSTFDVIVGIHPKKTNLYKTVKPGAVIIASFDKDREEELIAFCKEHTIALLSMNLIPRISRAQRMDSLSSQANIAGYRAVIDALYHFQKVLPMMMTAAGMIKPAQVLILGAGVAGLQAIATAKRMGAVVYAFDVRSAAKEQVESLGASFVEVEDIKDNENAQGYAKALSEDEQQKQLAAIDKYARTSDIVIATALIPGRPAPILLPAETVAAMRPGSVIVDMATARGGNCAVSEKDKTIDYHGITIIGDSILASKLAGTASDLYGNNLVALLGLMVKDKMLNFADEIVQQSLLNALTSPATPSQQGA